MDLFGDCAMTHPRRFPLASEILRRDAYSHTRTSILDSPLSSPLPSSSLHPFANHGSRTTIAPHCSVNHSTCSCPVLTRCLCVWRWQYSLIVLHSLNSED